MPDSRAAGTSWCAAIHPSVERRPDTVVSSPDGITFYHRVLGEYPSMWTGDLKNQEMPEGLPNPLINTTFGGYLTGGADSKLVASGPMQMTSATASILGSGLIFV